MKAKIPFLKLNVYIEKKAWLFEFRRLFNQSNFSCDSFKVQVWMSFLSTVYFMEAEWELKVLISYSYFNKVELWGKFLNMYFLFCGNNFQNVKFQLKQ